MQSNQLRISWPPTLDRSSNDKYIGSIYTVQEATRVQFLKLISYSFQITNFISNVISFLCLVSFPFGFRQVQPGTRNHETRKRRSSLLGVGGCSRPRKRPTRWCGVLDEGMIYRYVLKNSWQQGFWSNKYWHHFLTVFVRAGTTYPSKNQHSPWK